MNSTAARLTEQPEQPDIHLHQPDEALVPERKLGSLTFANKKHSRFTLKCDAVACCRHVLSVASLSGPATSVKAAAAVLNTNLSCEIRTYDFDCDGLRNNFYLERSEAGYRVYRHRLPGPFKLWHFLVIEKNDRLIPSMSDEALWLKLKSDRFTTPILRDWMPWIRCRMEEENLLQCPTSFQCSPAVISPSFGTAGLDALVSEGLREGHLAI